MECRIPANVHVVRPEKSHSQLDVLSGEHYIIPTMHGLATSTQQLFIIFLIWL
jgi:hypothetical protein